VLLIALIAAATAALLLVPATGSALVLGLGDENPATFTNPDFVTLHVKRTRLIAPYDAILHKSAKHDRGQLDAWLTAARAAKLEVVVAFNPTAGTVCPGRACRPPTVVQYTRAFKAFHLAYPWVRIVQPWNEVNSVTQPTKAHPESVVAYYGVVHKLCPSCTILGADLQDLPNIVSYARKLLTLFTARHIATPKLWGIHNYSDVNRFLTGNRSETTKALAVLPGRIWLTETGGLYRFRPAGGAQSFRSDQARQKKAVDFLVRQALANKRIERVYLYSFFGAGSRNRFDAGLVDAKGKRRSAYTTLLAHDLRLFR
jgi:hypothetical protein